MKPTPSWTRRLAALLLGLALALLIAEASALARIGGGEALAGARDQLAAQVGEGTAGIPEGPVAVHPYLGFTSNPTHPWPAALGEVNELGLHGPLPPRGDQAPGVLVVAVTGGSVAQHQVSHGGERLLAGLGRLPRFRGRELRLTNLALGGFKQPQQLMTLAYLLTLGYRLDLVINLDGFNEVALPPHLNTPQGVAASFPREWGTLASAAMDPLAIRALGRADALQQRRRALARGFSALPWAWSRAATLLWSVLDSRLEQQLQALHARELLARSQRGGLHASIRGPRLHGEGLEPAVEHGVGVWESASRQMAVLCRGQGVEYHHALQPNQYYEGTKPLSPEERRTAFDERHPYRPGARSGLARLRAAGERLVASGVDFHDLTGLFEEEAGARYSDSCCHLNQAGIDELTDALVAAVGARTPDPVAPPR